MFQTVGNLLAKLTDKQVSPGKVLAPKYFGLATPMVAGLYFRYVAGERQVWNHLLRKVFRLLLSQFFLCKRKAIFLKNVFFSFFQARIRISIRASKNPFPTIDVIDGPQRHTWPNAATATKLPSICSGSLSPNYSKHQNQINFSRIDCNPVWWFRGAASRLERQTVVTRADDGPARFIAASIFAPNSWCWHKCLARRPINPASENASSFEGEQWTK